MVRIHRSPWGLPSAFTFSLLACAMLVGCVSTNPRSAPTLGTMEGARTFLQKDCVVAKISDHTATAAQPGGAEAGAFAGLLVNLAPSIVEHLVDFVAAYAEQRGRGYSSTSTAAGSAVLPAGSIKGCLIYVAGAFGDKLEDAPGADWAPDKLRQLGLVRRPDVYVEWVVHSLDSAGTNVTLTPVHLDFFKPQSAHSSEPARKNLSFVVELSAPTLSPPASLSHGGPPPAAPAAGGGPANAKPVPKAPAAAIGTAIAAFPVTFGTIRVGSRFHASSLAGMTAPMQQIGTVTYANLLVTAVETEDGGDFLLKFAEFVTKNKAKINEPLISRLQEIIGKSNGDD
ncbi:MAG: hypothetical protein KIT86_11050 [Hydrogenophaga sp.]|uniref:hypothetical protein n=1 Tax=Hydrogenophaga sp. TaxID=1904254 RepID=UPI002630B976|nr:hypothetical protein [Hydrogenophaga sp.]MCW5670193.1 hypothetical protein [Hydrogenophaga sp.]